MRKQKFPQKKHINFRRTESRKIKYFWINQKKLIKFYCLQEAEEEIVECK